MEVLFHFIFELVKISILASVYSALILILAVQVGKKNPDGWFARISNNKRKFLIRCGFLISIGLFTFMQTYWGNHGLGDSARVPVGHFKVVKEINGNHAYIEKEKYDQLGIKSFAFDNENVFASTQSSFNGAKGDYVIWNLRENEWTFYRSKTEYTTEAKKNGYPSPEDFEDFYEHYKRHWNGWRFWLLP